MDEFKVAIEDVAGGLLATVSGDPGGAPPLYTQAIGKDLNELIENVTAYLRSKGHYPTVKQIVMGY